jgi:hypothetical protein
MQSGQATIRLPNGSRVLCYPGDLVGRMEGCRVRIEDPRVSEAHALFSARDGRLFLLYLRKPRHGRAGVVWHDELVPNTVLPLAEGVAIEVLDVQPPPERLALALDDGEPVPLGDGKYAIDPAARPFLVVDGAADVWRAGSDHYLRTDDGVQAILQFEEYRVRGHVVRASVVRAETEWTRAHAELIRTQIHLARTDSGRARIEDETGRTGELTNKRAEVFYALAQAGGRADWLQVCIALWGKHKGPSMRTNLYNNVLHRLDAHLRKLGLRDDLILRSDGSLQFGPGVDFDWDLEPTSEP